MKEGLKSKLDPEELKVISLSGPPARRGQGVLINNPPVCINGREGHHEGTRGARAESEDVKWSGYGQSKDPESK